MEISTLTREGLLLLAATGAGAVNAVAGGGTLITFPALIWLGLPSITANATSTVGLVPGAISGTWGYRREVGESAKWLAWLLPPSILGGLVGAVFLVKTPPAVFDTLAPLLVLGATALFMVQDRISRRVAAQAAEPGAAHRTIVAIAQLIIAVYGGYFGAGMGILSLAALGLLHLGSIHRMNGLKTFTGGCVNGVASAMFIVQGMVRWPEALTMAVGSTLGGYLAADGARRLGQKTVRRMVVGVGLAATVILGAQRIL